MRWPLSAMSVCDKETSLLASDPAVILKFQQDARNGGTSRQIPYTPLATTTVIPWSIIIMLGPALTTPEYLCCHRPRVLKSGRGQNYLDISHSFPEACGAHVG